MRTIIVCVNQLIADDQLSVSNNSNDILYAGSGADQLVGGTGNDLAIGGTGNDKSIVANTFTGAQNLPKETFIPTERNSHMIEPFMNSLSLQAVLCRTARIASANREWRRAA